MGTATQVPDSQLTQPRGAWTELRSGHAAVMRRRLVGSSVLFRKLVARKSDEIGPRQEKKHSEGRSVASIFDAVFGSILVIFYATNLRNRTLGLRWHGDLRHAAGP